MILVWLSGAFILGILLGTASPLPVTGGAIVTAVVLGAAVAALAAHRRRLGGVLLVVAALGAGTLRSPEPLGVPSLGDLRFYNGRTIQVQGVVAAEPDVRDTSIIYVISARTVTVRGHPRPVSGQVQVRTPRAQQLDYGDAAQVTGRLQPPRNSATGPWADILAQQGIYSEMFFPRLVNQGPTSTGLLGWVVPLRQHLEAGINAWLPEPEAALLIAITLGAHSASLGDLTPILISTGLIHLIAISGIKVALVAGTFYNLATLARRRTLALALSLAVLAFYVVLTGVTASGERSALMWAMVFLAAYLGRGTVPLVSLSFVAALMVAFDPSLLWNTGFLMSVCGTMAIVAYSSEFQQFLSFIPSPWREAFSTTVAAQLGTLPITVVGFKVLVLTSAMSNTLVLPLLPLLIVLGFLVGISSGISVLAAPLGSFAYMLTHLVILAAAAISHLPGDVPLSGLNWTVVAVYYALCAAVAHRILRRSHWNPAREWRGYYREFSLSLVLIASTTTVTLSQANSGPGTQLLWLGSGDAMLLRSGGTTALLGGSASPFQLLERLGDALPATTRTIDLMVVTDPRAATMTSLQQVLQHYGVAEVLDVGSEYPSSTYANWRADLRSRHIPAYALRTGASVRIGRSRLEALGPDALYSDPRDCIGLLRVTLAHQAVVIAGQASKREQFEAVFRHVNLRANVLVIDGSPGYDPAFVRAVHPATVFSSSRLRGLGMNATLPGGRTSTVSLESGAQG